MGCATSIVKYIVFLFNFIFVLGAIAFIGVGVWLKLNVDDIASSEQLGFVMAAPISIIVIGCIVLVISFFGCCGAIKESTCMLTTYAVILIVLLIAQIAIGIYAFIQVKEGNLNKSDVGTVLKEFIDDYDKNEVAKEAIDSIQKGWECCGINSFTDWTNKIPDSCCASSKCNSGNAYKKGCLEPVYDGLRSGIKIVGIVVITIAAVELVGAIFSLCLSSSIRNNERRGHYA